MMTKTINIFSENINKNYDVDEKKAVTIARKVLGIFLADDKISKLSCLCNSNVMLNSFQHRKDERLCDSEINSERREIDFDTISFDILFCDSVKTHKINKEYRKKDYPADIITFAIFADSEEKFIFDGEINLGEIIIALDRIELNAKEKNVTFEDELYFLIAHGIMHLLGFDHQTEEDYNFVVEAQTSALKKV